MSYKSLKEYQQRFCSALDSVDEKILFELIENIKFIIEEKSEIFLIGNGGSAANAHHIAGDFTKTFAIMGKNLRITCLSDNECYVTAAANDYGYEEIYELLIDNRIGSDDLLILFSGSGNSMNLVKVAQKAKKSKIKVAAILGFNGGALKNIVDVPIHTQIDDMEIAEDCQMAIFHYIKQKLVEIYKSKNSNQSNKYKKRIEEDLIA